MEEGFYFGLSARSGQKEFTLVCSGQIKSSRVEYVVSTLITGAGGGGAFNGNDPL
jgi:hypothetical protein